MSNQKKYHAAIEIKTLTLSYLKNMIKLKECIVRSEEDEFICVYNNVINFCQELFDFSAELAKKEKPPEIIGSMDRGINDFINWDKGGGCGGGDCGSCGSGGCSP